jgi:hypothetical protein
MGIKFWLESMKGRCHLEDLDIDMRIILKCILRALGWECGLDLSGSG